MKKVIGSLIFLTVALSMINLTLGRVRILDGKPEHITRSRFLVENELGDKSFFCGKQNETCTLLGDKEATCCYHKCVDLKYNFHHCGACDNKCSLGQTCCGGECVNTGFDNNHCGACNVKCKPGVKCTYGMCDYA